MTTNLNEHLNEPGTPVGAPRVRLDVDFLVSYDKDSIIAELKRLAAELGKANVSAKDLDERGRVGYHMVVNHFGSLRRALEAAGLKPSRYTNATDTELLKLVTDLWVTTLRESGRRPRTAEVAKYRLPVAAATIIKRFGSWKKALLAAANLSAGEAITGTRVVSVRRAIPLGKRFMVIKRDKYRCRICNRAGVELEVDHIVPVSQGGSDRMDNLQTACLECNRGKAGRLQ